MRRLRKLEKQLKVPLEDVTECVGELRQADTVVVKAMRIHHRASSLKLDENFNVINGKENTPSIITALMNQGDVQMEPSEAADKPAEVSLPTGLHLHRYPSAVDVTFLSAGKAEQKRPSWRRKGKSVWQGRSPNSELTVEQRALEYYQDQGYRG